MLEHNWGSVNLLAKKVPLGKKSSKPLHAIAQKTIGFIGVVNILNLILIHKFKVICSVRPIPIEKTYQPFQTDGSSADDNETDD